jgi:hypothetical protein
VSTKIRASTPDINASMAPALLRPENANSVFPSLDVGALRAIRDCGWKVVGIVAALVDEQQRLLMLRHKGSEKTPDGAWGPLAETSQFSVSQGVVQVVEGVDDTISRAGSEELGIDLSLSGVSVKRFGSWLLNSWPVGVSYPGQQAYAVCPFLYVDSGVCAGFAETQEIEGYSFMRPDEIMNGRSLRSGTEGWLRSVLRSGLVGLPANGRIDLRLPSPANLQDGVDINFNRANFL